MIHTETSLRHGAFFEALAGGDETTDAWRAAKAGLVTLRLLDAWHADAAPRTDISARVRGRDRAMRRAFRFEVDAVHDAIAELPADDAERRLLGTIVARIVAAQAGEAPRIVAPLFAYARSLHVRSAWGMAAVVYAVLWEAYAGESTIGPIEGDVATAAALYLGVCYRTVGDAERATEAFRAAGALADERGDQRGVLRARLGEAKICAGRGELTLAHERLVAIIAAATGSDCGEVRAYAWHDLAHVALQRGRYEEGIGYGYEAWAMTSDAVERERVMVTLASLLLLAGYADVARDANTLLADTAHEPVIRWIATVNLIEISTIERRELDFMRHRRALAGAALPPGLAGEFEYYVGLGHQSFGQPVLAAAAFDRAVTVAERHGLAELVQRAGAARVAVHTGNAVLTPRRAPRTPRPVGVARVAEAIHGARLLAAVSG